MLIALANLRPDPQPVRRTFDPAADAELLQSLQAAGQWEPIIVLPPEGDIYTVKNGNRRLRLAAVAGLPALEAHILPAMSEADAAELAIGTNTLRQSLAPVDLWRALVGLQSLGKTLPDAAARLGMSERQAQRIARLGSLAPAVLALIERHGMPQESHLRTIAAAPLDMQKKAAAVKGLVTKAGDAARVDWRQLAELCTLRRYPRTAAIFDLAKVKITWQQDVFAEPGSPEEWTTTEGARFLKAQRQALADLAAASKGKMQAVEEDTRWPGSPELPKGWEATHKNPDKPARKEVVYACIAERTGELVRVTAIDAAAEAAAAKEKERQAREKAKAEAEAARSAARTLAQKAPPATDASDKPAIRVAPEAADKARAELAKLGEAAGEPAEEPEATAPTAEETAPLTKEGQKMLAALKTDALRARLRHSEFEAAEAEPARLIAFLILALHARNVEVRGYYGPQEYRYGSERGLDIVRRLVTPEGHLQFDAAELPRLACTTLARVLSASHTDASTYAPGSGDVAEWIGHAIGAEACFAPITTADFLATWKSPALRQAAQLAGVKFATSTQARRDLAGKLDEERRTAPFWCPTFAHFGAPGPKPAKREG